MGIFGGESKAETIARLTEEMAVLKQEAIAFKSKIEGLESDFELEKTRTIQQNDELRILTNENEELKYSLGHAQNAVLDIKKSLPELLAAKKELDVIKEKQRNFEKITREILIDEKTLAKLILKLRRVVSDLFIDFETYVKKHDYPGLNRDSTKGIYENKLMGTFRENEKYSREQKGKAHHFFYNSAKILLLIRNLLTQAENYCSNEIGFDKKQREIDHIIDTNIVKKYNLFDTLHDKEIEYGIDRGHSRLPFRTHKDFNLVLKEALGEDSYLIKKLKDQTVNEKDIESMNVQLSMLFAKIFDLLLMLTNNFDDKVLSAEANDFTPFASKQIKRIKVMSYLLIKTVRNIDEISSIIKHQAVFLKQLEQHFSLVLEHENVRKFIKN